MRVPGARVALVWGPPVHDPDAEVWTSRLYAIAPEIARVEEVGEATGGTRAELAVMRVLGHLAAAVGFYWWRLQGSPPPEEKP